MDRWIKEAIAIYIRKEQDKSMNRDEWFYQLSHVYDAAVATSSGERKSITSFRKKATPVAETSTTIAKVFR